MTAVKAEVHSDDYVFEVDFDATDYIANLSDDELRALRNIGWGGDYEADAVAQWYEDLNPEVTALFTYLGKKRGLRDAPGFECHVDQESVMVWLQENRPALHEEFQKGGGHGLI